MGEAAGTAHILYVAAAYAAAAFGVLGLIAWVFWDARARQRELRALEAEGVRRRSDAPPRLERP